MAVTGAYKQYFRIRKEASFDAATPQTAEDWNLSTTPIQGWMDLPAGRENDGLQPQEAKIFPAVASGQRGMNPAAPIAGAQLGELGSLELMGYGDMLGPVFTAITGDSDVKSNAGTAELEPTSWPLTTQALDTAPTGEEVLQLLMSSGGTTSSCVISILVGGSVVETINVPDGITSGTFYTKGGYSGTVTITTTGTYTSGDLEVVGYKYFQPAYYFGTSSPSFVIEQFGRPEVADPEYSEFFPGIIIPTSTHTFDREAADGMLAITANLSGINPDEASATGYNYDADSYYKPFASWHAQVLIDDVAWAYAKSMSLDINSNNDLYEVADGTQSATGFIPGNSAASGTLTVYPPDSDRYDDYNAETGRDIKIKLVSNEAVNQSTYFELQYHFPDAYIETYTRNRQGEAMGAELVIRGVTSQNETTPQGTSVDTPLIITRKGRVPF